MESSGEEDAGIPDPSGQQQQEPDVQQPSACQVNADTIETANIGTHTHNYNVKEHVENDFQNAHIEFHQQNIYHGTPPSQRQNPTEQPGLIELSGGIRMFHGRPLANRTNIFYGEQQSKVTGSRQLAIKSLPYSEKNVKEAKILSKLAHQNIVAIIHSDVYHQGPWKYMFIAMEMCHSQNLHELVIESREKGVPFDPRRSAEYAKQLVCGLNYIHQKGVVHRDLKPHNVLLSRCKNLVKIADFGLSKKMTSGRSVTNASILRVGTDGFRAPETYNSDVISQEADVYSLGLVVNFLLSDGQHPFGDDPDDWNSNIKKNRNRDLSRLLVPEKDKARTLLEKMLEFNPKNRPKACEVLDHAFFLSISTAAPPARLPADCGATGGYQSQRQGQEQGGARRKTGNNQPSTNQCLQPGPLVASSQAPSSLYTSLTEEPEHWRRSFDLSDFDFAYFGKQTPPTPDIKRQNNALILFDKQSNNLKSFDPVKKDWTTLQAMTAEHTKYNFTTVVVSENIYTLLENGDVYRLRFADKAASWYKMTKMLAEHGHRPPATVLDGHIYVVGSSGTHSKQKRVKAEKYDPVTNKWSEIEPVNNMRADHGLVAAKGCIYAIGGQAHGMLSSVERYKPGSGMWEAVSSLHYARSCPATLEYQDKIYVMGGLRATFKKSTKLTEVESYSVTTDEWTTINKMCMARSRFIACVLYSGIYAVGGDKEGFLEEKKTMEMLDVTKNQWKIITKVEKIKFDSMSSVAVRFTQKII